MQAECLRPGGCKMQIRVGVSANDLTTRTHATASFRSPARLAVVPMARKGAAGAPAVVEPGQLLVVSVSGSSLALAGLSPPLAGRWTAVRINPQEAQAPVCLESLERAQAGGRRPPCYRGAFEVALAGGRLRVVLVCDADGYVEGVLGSEVPAGYRLEAIKAQAVAARTYGLRPRIDHSGEGFNVCDSYLCCQNFNGNAARINAGYRRAIEETSEEVLVYQDRPILALFSSNAGGHTENYENCFSDPLTDRFPPEPIPYLKAVPEGKLPAGFPGEPALRSLWHMPGPQTCDAWAPQFRWRLAMPADALEAHMHHVVERMGADPQFAPFIAPPPSGRFGHIDRFEVGKRGASGVAITLAVHTSAGTWLVTKELVIRSLFENPDLKLTRLRSARIFFDHGRDRLGLLSELVVSGLGSGHGVGLQQTGAQGLAVAGAGYRQILHHYYSGARVERMPASGL